MHSTEDLRRAMVDATAALTSARGPEQIVRAGRRRRHRRRAAVAGAACLAALTAMTVPGLLRGGDQPTPVANGGDCPAPGAKNPTPGDSPAPDNSPTPDPSKPLASKPAGLVRTGAPSTMGGELVFWLECVRDHPNVMAGSLDPTTDRVKALLPTIDGLGQSYRPPGQPGFLDWAYTESAKNGSGLLYGLVRGPARRITSPAGSEAGLVPTNYPGVSIYWVTGLTSGARGSIVPLDGTGNPIDDMPWPHPALSKTKPDPASLPVDQCHTGIRTPQGRELVIRMFKEGDKLLLKTVERDWITGRMVDTGARVPTIDRKNPRNGFSDIRLTLTGFTSPVHIGVFVGPVGRMTATDGGRPTKVTYCTPPINRKIAYYWTTGTAPEVTVYDLSGKVIGRRP